VVYGGMERGWCREWVEFIRLHFRTREGEK
jgi:hypothetical protein